MIEIIPNWHPIFVHFTVALFFIAVVFFFLARFGTPVRWREQWMSAAQWTLWAGAAITIITVGAGWYAFNTVKHDSAAHEVMLEHRSLAIVTFLYFMAMATWAWRMARVAKPVSAAFLAAMVVGAGLVTATAWHGGELVYRHGLGVISLSKPEGPGHSHTHAGGEQHGHDDAPTAAPGTEPEGEAAHHHDGPEATDQPATVPGDGQSR